MPTYHVTLKDHTVEVIEGADAYQQEGQMTTFFATREGRDVVDSWAVRVASFRTSEILIVRRWPSLMAERARDTDDDESREARLADERREARRQAGLRAVRTA
jgi:hypothetical protein